MKLLIVIISVIVILPILINFGIRIAFAYSFTHPPLIEGSYEYIYLTEDLEVNCYVVLEKINKK